MFGIDWGNSQTLWLTLTNLALGIVTLLALGVVAFGVAQEIVAKRRRARAFAAMDDEVRHMVNQKANTVELRKRAREMGMRTLREDGIRKVLSGMTTAEEVISVSMGDE